uniref:Tyrosine-protein kinase n=1 Tax=Haemonchus contortus TaxID=6289 RepID=A0A7I4XS35_HAECO
MDDKPVKVESGNEEALKEPDGELGKDDEATRPAQEAPSFDLVGTGHTTKTETDMLGFALDRILADLEKEEWYHGCLPLEDIAGLLKNEGDFLIRGLDTQADFDYGILNIVAWITIKWEGKVQDYPLRYKVVSNEHIFTIDGTNKNKDIMELIKYHHSSGTPVKDGVVLKTPIPKQKWELRSDKVKLSTKIGAGAFGEVWVGTMQETPNDPPIQVAVKLTKVDKENQTIMDDMYKEARLMRQYRHKNVVRFYGVAQKSADNAMIVMEYVDGGALNNYLRKNTNLPTKMLVGYAIDAATGLAYLHAKVCMHRDIACRNCLIDVSKGIVKLSDFGLSKQAETYNIPKDEKIPIKWQAPEVIATRVYTAKSDVYSYGILLWEIFNYGQTPYKGMDNKTVREKVIFDPKFRPPTDETLPLAVIKVMNTCWRADPEKRPTMARVVQYFKTAAPQKLVARSEPVRRASSSPCARPRTSPSTGNLRIKESSRTSPLSRNVRSKESGRTSPSTGNSGNLRCKESGRMSPSTEHLRSKESGRRSPSAGNLRSKESGKIKSTSPRRSSTGKGRQRLSNQGVNRRSRQSGRMKFSDEST